MRPHGVRVQRGSAPRLLVVAGILAMWSAAALIRLSYVELFRYSDYLTRANHQQQRVVTISAKRADIFDRNLHELAMSAEVDSCFAVPSEIADPELVGRLLGPVLKTSPSTIQQKLSSSRTFVWIARKLPPETADRIRALNLKGIYFQQEDQRFYPKRELAASVLGYVDIDEKGLAGVEYGLDDRMRSKPGKVMIMADARRRWYESTEDRPDKGTSAVLTIDENIQYIAEKELGAAMRETRSKAGTVIVQDPSTGEILAMASWPTFNPNAPSGVSPEARMNRAVAALYEPGSVFKIVTLSAAIDQGITNAGEIIDCQQGSILIAGHRIHDHHPFGNLTVAQILAHSSDVGTIKLGLRLGAPKFYDYIRAYGFGSPTGIDLPGESKGLLRRVENWSAISIGAISMGQEVGVTPVQIITAMSAIANGGLLYRPHVIQTLRTPSGDLTQPQPDPVRVIKPTTAATMRNMLEGVVLEGTGTKARLDGYTSAGKTGTAQKIDPATGRYSATQLIASFVGFAPINNPAVTILVQLDSPVGLHEGGSVAAPVFKKIAEQVLAYRNVPHDEVLSPAQLRAARGAAGKVVEGALDDFDPVQIATSDISDEVEPSRELQSTAKAAAPQTAEFTDADGIVVPRLLGKNIREVTQISLRLGFNPVLVGNGIVEAQEPDPGATVRRGGSVTVRFARSTGAAASRGSAQKPKKQP